jgi:sugar (pentulose or hexulose) kinase
MAKAQVEYPPYVSPGPGLAEQDPTVYWDALVRACRELKEKKAGLVQTIAGIGVTTQRATMICLDQDGNVLRPAIVWLDQRTAEPVFATSGLVHLGVKLSGLKSRLMEAQAQGKCNWIIQNQPGIWAATYKYLQVSGFLNFRLTGEFKDSVASQIGHLPFDYKRHRWAGPWALTRRLFCVPTEKLPDLVQPGALLGSLTGEAAELTGLAQGIPVIACGSDKGCETLGSGVIDQTMVSLSFGTTATVQTCTDRYFESIPLMPPYPAPIPGFYNPGVEIFRGFWMISWFKKEFGQKEVEKARILGKAPEELLNQCLEKTEPGAMGLLIQPYWGPGLDHPNAKGAMIGFGDVHTRDHIYRAVIEGLGFALLEGMERIQARGKVRVEQAALSGGASQSDAICQIAADIFNLPMAKAATHETSGLGAAILTAAGTGLYPGIRDAVDQMARPAVRFLPNPQAVEIYRNLYCQVYKNMYSALAPLYRKIQAITGYPPKVSY